MLAVPVPYEERSQHTGTYPRAHHAQSDPGNGKRRSPPVRHGKHHATLGPEGDPDPNLSGALGRGVCSDAIDAGRGEPDAEERKDKNAPATKRSTL
jgi:hypothetical protein